MPDSPLQQTFGVELEFAVKILLQPGGFSQRTAVHEPMARILTAGGFPVNAIGSRRLYQKWSVEGDVSINPERSEDDDPNPRAVYFGVELKSRVLPVNRASFDEICQVVDIVNLNFQIVRNLTTGCHVHVGNEGRGFSLRCLKNLAELVTLFEHQIESIHSDDRIENFFCASLSLNNTPGGPFDALAKIEQIEDMGTFLEHMNPGEHRFLAYNFLNLRAPRDIQTVEFRQHRGTMDTTEILAWVEFTTGLVSYCHSIPPDQLMTLMLTFGTDHSFSILDLLRVIGKTRLISYYRRRLVDRDRF